MERMDYINEILIAMNAADGTALTYDSLKPAVQRNLIRVAEAIASQETIQKQALATYRDARYNVSSIAKQLQFSRTTLYNHDKILVRFIEEASKKNTNVFDIVEEQKEELRVLKQHLDLMHSRDMEWEDMKIAYEEMQNDYEAVCRKNKELDKRIRELGKKITELQSGTPTETSATAKIRKLR